jgi:hypothetical protein
MCTPTSLRSPAHHICKRIRRGLGMVNYLDNFRSFSVVDAQVLDNSIFNPMSYVAICIFLLEFVVFLGEAFC